MRVLVLDNYDSFTWNLVQSLESSGGRCLVHRSDSIDIDQVTALAPDRIVLSPGPFGPERAGVCAAVVRRVSPHVPTLGICLGMQVIASCTGARIAESGNPVHGMTRKISHRGAGVLRGLPTPLEVGLYHSLVVVPDTMPEDLEVTARSEDGTIMGCRVRATAIEGLLFHPESFLTPHGNRILRSFLQGGHVG